MKVRKKGRILTWFRDNKKKIIVIAIGVCFVIILNYIIGSQIKPLDTSPITTYDPSYPIISTDYTIPENEKNQIEEIIDDYINYCNNKEYSNAFNLLSSNCKKVLFNNELSNFSLYVLQKFGYYKIYDIQNLSNDEDHYIYRLRTMYDYLSLGLNSYSEMIWEEEEITVVKENNEFKISIQSYIDSSELNKKFSDENIIINIEKVDKYYDKEIYTIKVKSISQNYIILNNAYEDNAVLLSVEGDDLREISSDIEELDSSINDMYLAPFSEKSFELKFDKYFDEFSESEKIIFNKVRIFNKYTGIETNYEEEKKNAINEYAIEIDLTD